MGDVHPNETTALFNAECVKCGSLRDPEEQKTHCDDCEPALMLFACCAGKQWWDMHCDHDQDIPYGDDCRQDKHVRVSSEVHSDEQSSDDSCPEPGDVVNIANSTHVQHVSEQCSDEELNFLSLCVSDPFREPGVWLYVAM